MRVFVAGGSGAMGRRGVPQLIEHRHEVVAAPADAPRPGATGSAPWASTPLVMDGLDAGSVGEAVARAEPEGVRAPDDGARRRG